ncbi:MAG: hypothetical protein ACRDWI_02175 [Jiangellaceae bacterium]
MSIGWNQADCGWSLDSSPTIAGRVEHLAAREMVCCSFFTSL